METKVATEDEPKDEPEVVIVEEEEVVHEEEIVPTPKVKQEPGRRMPAHRRRPAYSLAGGWRTAALQRHPRPRHHGPRRPIVDKH